ncbi:DUF4240 domain-containing protein [Streptomyces sp. ventii]|uniref:DUF4240 domain-containing protein n=2 Tax=Streptomyces spiramenti TaxID=2720606 RepID=A0ABX1AS45_9ACTN|nr:DUF4240 domain-containing protein [Streptomyces spiramenti]
MDEERFWRLVEECRPPWPDPDADDLSSALVERLTAEPATVTAAFAETLSRLLWELDRRELGEDESSDSFLHTRAAVVAAGERAYRTVRADPVRFAPFATGPVRAGSLLSVPGRAWRRLTGEEWQRDTRYTYESYSNRAGWECG